MKPLGITRRMLLIAMAPAASIAILLSYFSLTSRIEELDRALAERGAAIARQLAPASEYGLFSGNRDILQRLSDAALREEEVAAVAIRDITGRALALSGRPSSAPIALEDKPFLFQVPVIQSQTRLSDLVELDPGAAAQPTRRLGTVIVSVDRRPTAIKKQRIILMTLLIAGSVLLVTWIVAMRFARSVSRPIVRLTEAVNQIEQGNLKARVKLDASAEFALLARGFNRMAASLQTAQETLEAKINEVTRQLEEQSLKEANAMQAKRLAAEAAREAAESANRSKSRFLASASHDLRQPLHALGLFAAALNAKTLDAETRDIALQIEHSIKALDSLFNALLDVSKLDAGAVVPALQHFSLLPLLQRIEVDYLPEALQKGLRFKVRKRPLAAHGDPILLERILRNLVSNAVRYTRRGGVLVGVRSEKSALRIEVWDTGIGIDEAFHQEVFSEFFQLANPERDREKGLGLGLAIVDRVAKLLGWPITVRSKPHRGSCFSVTVPKGLDADAANHGPPEFPPLHNKHVVLIDDEPAVLKATATLLAGWGCDVIAAEDLDGALDRLVNTGVRPGLVLADYRLRDNQTGLNAIGAIRKHFDADIPAVLVTGEMADAVIDAEINGLPILHKPVNAARLRSIVTALCR